MLCCGRPRKRVDNPGDHPQIRGTAGQIFWQCELRFMSAFAFQPQGAIEELVVFGLLMSP